MALSPGTRIGAYEVLSLLGRGGMGEVYRARDTKLDRDVAIKVLPELFVSDPERVARFQREAKTLAALNHPHIGGICGLEDADGVRALVLELVEGPTLADLIAQGPIPLDEALPIARQIAEALETAHEAGIIHRDLKPANIKLRLDGTVKVLDFGLAKASDTGPLSSDASRSPTVTSPAMTKVGVMLGTAAYMSPEQARGRPTDKRSDIWAFGCVLYEMVAGRRLYQGATVTETLAAVLERQPDWDAIPPAVPPTIRKLLQRCLEKDVRRRLHDVADARLELEDTHPEPALSPDRGYHWRAWVVIVLCSAATGALGWLIGARAKPEPLDMSRVLLDVRPATSLLGSNPIERAATGRSRPSRTAVALSPNGRIVAFTAQRDGVTKLYIRALDQTEATAVAGTEGADSPMFSPNGNWIGFWSNNAIRKVSLAGGPPVKVCDARLPYGSSWSADGTIVFASQDTMIWKVDSGGGKRQRITNRGQAGDDVRDLLPQILPGGKWLLFTVQPTVFDWEHTRVVAQSLETGERKVVLEDAADARYVPTGHLVFMRQGNLMAAPFDVDRGRLTGSETGMVEGVMQSINANSVPLDTGAGQFAFSSTGTLVYVAGEVHPDVEGTLQWIDRNGRIEQIAAPRRLYFLPRLSPDGRHVVVTTFGIQDHSLWRYDFADHTLLRLTTEGHVAWPFWSPDGTQIAFCLAITGPLNLFVLGADGGVAPRRLGQSPVTQFSGSWTPDGRSIVYDEDPTNHDIKILPASGELKSQPLIATRFNEQMPELSPDGRWIAYVFDETGRGEVGVQAFPHLGQKRQISTAGGTNPAWSRDGRKLTFLTRPERPRDEFMQLMEMDVTPGANFTSTPARPLFEPVFGGDIARSYDMTADASRFIFVHHTYPPSTSAPRELQVVEHWFEELKARVPTK